jgi:hypothetical protein
MRIIERSNLKTGPGVIEDVHETDILYFSSVMPCTLTISDPDGEIVGQQIVQGNQRVRLNRDCDISVDIAQYQHWGYDICSSREISDPVPFEVITDRKPETLQEKMQRMVQQIAHTTMALNNAEVETLEEALDFDVDGEGEVALSGYGVIELVDEMPKEPPEEPKEPPQEPKEPPEEPKEPPQEPEAP